LRSEGPFFEEFFNNIDKAFRMQFAAEWLQSDSDTFRGKQARPPYGRSRSDGFMAD